MNADLDLTRTNTFKIYTGLLKAARGVDGKMRLHGTASSTVKDLHGDTMMPSAIADMETSANKNLTIFLNHSYNVPEDVGGSVERASSISRGFDTEGNQNVDLMFDIVINDANPRAVQTFEAIERGTKLGLSIGAMVPQGGATRNKDGTFLINHVDLLETSIVGIPANPRSWVEYAVKSLRRSAPLVEETEEEATFGFEAAAAEPLVEAALGEEVEITNDAEGGEVIAVVEETEIEDAKKPAGHTHPHAHTHAHDHSHWNGLQHSHDHSHTHAHGHDDAHEHDDAMQGEEHSHSHSGSWDEDHPHDESDKSKAVDLEGDALLAHLSEPDVADSTTVTITVATDDPEPSSGNAAQLADETAEGDDQALGDNVTRNAPELGNILETLSLLTQSTRELVEARKRIVDLEAAKAAAERDRDEATRQRDTVLAGTKDILDKVAKSPLVRRTVAVDAQRDFDARFKGVYSEEFLRMLKGTNDGE